MEKISAVICTYQEKANIADCIRSMEGVDEVIVADDGSTDGTVEIAESLGAKVFRRSDHNEIATQKDVDDFIKRFGWAPAFKEGSKIHNGHLRYLQALSFATNDWCVMPDADERISWDLPRLRKEVMPIADQITSKFVHSHDEKGNPHRVSTITKMFRKSVTKIEGRTHCCIIPYGRMVSTDLMQIDHWQKPNAIVDGKPVHSQGYVLAIMEYSTLKDNDGRSRFYTGREYYYYHEYDHAIRLLNEYLSDAKWMPEIAHAHLYLARSYWESQRGDKAREHCLEAIKINPDHKEALQLYSEMHYSPWKEKWAYIASNATDKDILF